MAPFGVELMAVLGPLARTVADLRVAFEVMAGAHLADPWSYPAVSTAGALLDLPPRRVAVSTDPGGGGTHPNIVAAIEQAANILEAAGWEVEVAEPPELDQAARLWPELNFGNPTNIDGMIALLSPDAQLALQRWAFAAGVMPDGNTFVDALQRRSLLLGQWTGFFQTHGLWLTATATELPFEVGADLEGTERVERILNGHRVIMATNSLGLPSAVIPTGVTDGLPQSIQIIGPRFAESACLDAAETIEQNVEMAMPMEPASNPA
jgi:amidase